MTVRVLATIAAVVAFQMGPQQAMADTASYGISATANAQTFTTTFTDSSGFNGNVLLDTELWDSKNNRVFQYFETRDLSGANSASITKPVTAGLPNGTYTVKAGMFTANWAQSLLWSDNAGIVTVANGAAAATTFEAVSSLNGTAIDTTFKTAQAATGQYLFDVELWDANNKRVFQHFDTYSLNNSNTMTVSRQLPTLTPGVYTARVGAFLPGWTTKLLWSDNAGTITIGAAPAVATTYASTARVSEDRSTFETDFTSSRNLSASYMFDVELWDSNNKRVYQSFNTYALNNSNKMTVTRAVPTNLAEGKYTIKSGWFTPTWSTSLLWNENAGTLVIGKAAVPTATTTTVTPPVSTTVAPIITTTAAPTTTTTAAPRTTTTTSPVVITKPTTPESGPLTFNARAIPAGNNFETTFTANHALTGKYLYDIELYDAQNKKSFQGFEVRDHNGNTETKVSQLIPTNIPAGKYTVKTGVFSADWSVKYLWSENSGTIDVAPWAAVVNDGSGPVGAPGSWNKVFGDEFNGAGLDKNKWVTCSRQLIWWKDTCMGHGKEQQAYTNDNVNIVDFGNGDRGLRLTARKTAPWTFAHDDVHAGATRYDSGMISTSPNTMNFNQPGYQPFDFKYGFYEVRMKAPRGKGFWPAAWAFPTDNVGPQELDLIEILGHDTNTSYMTVHYPGGNSSIGRAGVDTADGFHTFGMDWRADKIDWYIDGKLARTSFTNAGSIPDKNMYLMLNFAVGGQWPGAPDASTPNQGAMDVDWVRVWKEQPR